MSAKTVACFLAFLLSSNTIAFAQVLDGQQIKAALVGKSGTWASKDGKFKGTTSWTADKQTITGNFPGFTEDTGTWVIKGNQFCNKFVKVRQGKEECLNVNKIGDKIYDFGGRTIVNIN